MQINHNIPALRTLNALNKANGFADKRMRNLSSGKRINTAADDAAGLAISNKMQTQVRGLKRASMNAEDGISLVQTAEGCLGEVQNMLQRMRELAVQGANGTLAQEDRKAIQDEVDQLKEQISSTADLTEFNKLKLLNGQLSKRSFTQDNKIAVGAYVSDSVEPGEYIFELTDLGTSAKITFSGAVTGNAVRQTGVITEKGRVNINGEEVMITSGMTADEAYAEIRDLAERVGLKLTKDKNGILTLESLEKGSGQKITVYADNTSLLKQLGLATISGKYNPANPGTPGTGVTGTNAKIVIDSGSSYGPNATATIEGNRVTITDANNKKIIIDLQSGAAAALKAGKVNIQLNVLDAGPLQLQVGPNEGMRMEVQIPTLTSTALGLDYVNMRTEKGASKAITLCDNAINEISAVRSKLGAYQNRLEYTIANLDTTAENTTAAYSRIEDADMAEEMAEYTQKNVISQAGVNMLAQANQRPQQVLQLLQ